VERPGPTTTSLVVVEPSTGASATPLKSGGATVEVVGVGTRSGTGSASKGSLEVHAATLTAMPTTTPRTLV
jgi:hypothetical protein